MVSGCSSSDQRECGNDLTECLIDFLITEKEAANKEDAQSLFLVDLNDIESGNIYKKRLNTIKPGIYTFGLLGPHFSNYIVLVKDSNSFTIVEDYELEWVLSTLSEFFKKNDDLYTSEDKIKVVSNTLNILKNRLSIELYQEIPGIELNK